MLVQFQNELLAHPPNADWLDRHGNSLRHAIEIGLQDEDQRILAVDCLLHVFPQLLSHGDVKAWSETISDAVSLVSARYLLPAHSDQPTYAISESLLIRRLDHRSQVKSTSKRRRKRLNPRKLYEDYLILMLILWRDHAIATNFDRITQTLRLARHINHQELYFTTYVALAFIQNDMGNHTQALDMARLAFRHWQHHKHGRSALQSAVSAHEIARAYIGLGYNSHATYWLQIARDYSQMRSMAHYAEIRTLLRHEFERITARSMPGA